MGFSERLKELRHKRGLTQEQLADALDIPDTTIRRWESVGDPPKRERIEKLADFFGVSVDYLLGRTDDPAPPKSKGVVEDYTPFLRAIKEKYPGVNIDDPDVQRKLMRAIDLVLEDYLERQKPKQ